jgi:hypothetical protein
MNFREEIADLVLLIRENEKIKNFFQNSYIAERVNGVLSARCANDYSTQPIKLLQSDNIGNYFYILYNSENIEIMASNARLDSLLSVFIHELHKFDNVRVASINANAEVLLASEFETFLKVPNYITIASVDFTYDFEIPLFTSEICLDLIDFCSNC